MRLRELAASRVRFGYRRLTVMLRREGWRVNAKRIYRLYTEDGLAVRTKVRKKIARRMRVPMVKATRPNEKWSMDFVAARLIDGRWFRVLTVVDQFTRECLLLLADSSLTGQKVALALSQVVAERGAPVSITVDNGSEFVSKAMEAWAYQYRVDLDFIRPGRPVENGYIESFNNSAIRVNDEGAAGQTQPPELSTGLGQCVIRHGYGQSKRFGVCVALILRSPSFQNRSTMMLLLTGKRRVGSDREVGLAERLSLPKISSEPELSISVN